MKSILVAAILMTVLIAGTALAESPREKAQDKKEVVWDKGELKQTKDCLNRLTNLIDKWHEANLEGSEKDIRKYEQAIINTLVKDINASFHASQKSEREQARTMAQVKKGETVRAAVDDEKDLARVRMLMATKQALLYKMKKSDCFSVRYRLLSEYQELLRKELGMTRIELAEDIKDVRKDGK